MISAVMLLVAVLQKNNYHKKGKDCIPPPALCRSIRQGRTKNFILYSYVNESISKPQTTLKKKTKKQHYISFFLLFFKYVKRS